MNPLSFLDGFKTYLAAAGLFGMALYQFSQGQTEMAFQSLMAALAAVGLRSAVHKNAEETKMLLKRKHHDDEM
jgi:MFS-type transporter involved in bile tolerance (Atg22 family)